MYTDYMYSLVKRAIDEIGPRPSCSEQERKLGHIMVEEWKPFCNRVEVETFTCSPVAFLSSIPLSALFYFAAVISYWFLPPVSLVMIVIGISMILFELRYYEFIDFLFPRKQGENVVGVIQPAHEPSQRVIVSAHLDSAYEFNLFYYLKSASLLIFVIAALGCLILLGGSLGKTVAYATGNSDAPVFTVIGIITVAISPVMGLLLFFHSYRPVPGAMDDMTGIAVTTGLGKYLNEAKKNGQWVPERTEVVLLATSSEEAGLRGAKRYAKRHREEMKTVPTYGLFLDCIYDEKSLTVIDREYFTGAKHDRGLVEMAQDVARSHNQHVSVKPIPVGASDASAFSTKGIPSICILCQDPLNLVPNYHTRNDTYENVRPESLSAALHLVIGIIERIDR
ncbi:M28 family metallopeptidase [Chloroflexota bacterium]